MDLHIGAAPELLNASGFREFNLKVGGRCFISALIFGRRGSAGPPASISFAEQPLEATAMIDHIQEQIDFSTMLQCRRDMKRSFCFLGLAVLFACTSATTFAQVTKLAAGDREKLLKAADAPLVTTMHEIPPEVVKACAAASSGGGFELADAGKPFQVTDVITDEKLPGKRLDWAARIPGYMVVHYETGGIAHSYHVMVVALDADKKAHVTWAALAKPLKSYAEFRAALITGKLDDRFPYH